MACFELPHNTLSRASPQDADNAFFTPSEPPDSACASDATRMNCDLLRWAASQNQITPHLQGVLVRLTALMDDARGLSISQAEIARRIGMKPRQTRAAISLLVAEGVIVQQRRGGDGKGRLADILAPQISNAASGDLSPLAEQVATNGSDQLSPIAMGANGDTSPIAHNQTSPLAPSASQAMGDTPPVSNSSAHIEHAGARAQTLNKITTLSELHSEREETVGESEARGFALTTPTPAPQDKRGQRLPVNWRPSADGVKYAAKHGIEGDWLEVLIDNFVGYWANLPGAKALKLDWGLAWMGEVRKEQRAQRHKPRFAAKGPSMSRGPYGANGVTRLVAVG